MLAKKVDYLNEIYYIYEDGEQIATVHADTDVILWQDGEEPYNGATEAVMAVMAEIIAE